MAVLTYKVLHGTAPRYLGPLARVADLPGRHGLRSADTNRLAVPPYKLSTIGNRSFKVASAQMWNSLPHQHYQLFVVVLKLIYFVSHKQMMSCNKLEFLTVTLI